MMSLSDNLFRRDRRTMAFAASDCAFVRSTIYFPFLAIAAVYATLNNYATLEDRWFLSGSQSPSCYFLTQVRSGGRWWRWLRRNVRGMVAVLLQWYGREHAHTMGETPGTLLAPWVMGPPH